MKPSIDSRKGRVVTRVVLLLLHGSRGAIALHHTEPGGGTMKKSEHPRLVLCPRRRGTYGATTLVFERSSYGEILGAPVMEACLGFFSYEIAQASVMRLWNICRSGHVIL